MEILWKHKIYAEFRVIRPKLRKLRFLIISTPRDLVKLRYFMQRPLISAQNSTYFLLQKVTNMLTVTASKPSKHKGYNRFFSKADASRSRSKERLELLIGQGSFTWYVRNIILKTNITDPTSYLLTLRVRIRGVRNISFSENFTFVLSNSKLPKNMQKIITYMVQLPNKKNEKQTLIRNVFLTLFPILAIHLYVYTKGFFPELSKTNP